MEYEAKNNQRKTPKKEELEVNAVGKTNKKHKLFLKKYSECQTIFPSKNIYIHNI